MADTAPQWRWAERHAPDSKEHIELRFGDAGQTPYEDWLPIARIGRPEGNSFPVEWLVTADSPDHELPIVKARRELDFYLIELGEPDPWAYAQYHCNTSANMYSSIHWSYFPDGTCGDRMSSMVATLE